MLLTLLLSTQLLATEAEDAVDTSAWLCNFCGYPQGWFGTFQVGPGYASDASLKFADYRGIEDKGAFISIDGDIHYLDKEGKYFDLYARAASLMTLAASSQQLELCL